MSRRVSERTNKGQPPVRFNSSNAPSPAPASRKRNQVRTVDMADDMDATIVHVPGHEDEATSVDPPAHSSPVASTSADRGQRNTSEADGFGVNAVIMPPVQSLERSANLLEQINTMHARMLELQQAAEAHQLARQKIEHELKLQREAAAAVTLVTTTPSPAPVVVALPSSTIPPLMPTFPAPPPPTMLPPALPRPIAETSAALDPNITSLQELVKNQSEVIATLTAQMTEMQRRTQAPTGWSSIPAPGSYATSSMQSTVSNSVDSASVGGSQSSGSASSVAGSQFIGHKRLNDLPIFNGKTEEWPMFYASYRNSTLAFGYNEMENMYRLQKCLHGEARAAVTSLLVHAHNVEQVLSTLEMLFGQPEMLVRSQIESVRAFPPIEEHQLEKLAPFAAKVQNLVSFLDTDATRQHLADPSLIEELIMKLPIARRIDWAIASQAHKPCATVKEFCAWITTLARLVSSISTQFGAAQFGAGSSQRRSLASDRRAGKSNTVLISNVKNEPNDVSPSCKKCKGEHALADCREFRRLDVQERWTEAKKLRVCFACLKGGHSAISCRKKKPCEEANCSRKHHRLLHENGRAQTTNERTTNERGGEAASTSGTSSVSTEPVPGASTRPMNSCHSPRNPDRTVLLRIVPVKLYGPNSVICTFAILDEGSTVTLIDEAVADQLGLQGERSNLNLTWYGDNVSTESSRRVNLLISGADDKAEQLEISDAQTVNNLQLPHQTVNMADLSARYPLIRNLPIADYVEAVPQILIGVDNNHLGMPQRVVECDARGLIATQTRIGWIVYGRESASYVGIALKIASNEEHPLEVLHNVVHEFHATESFGVRVPERMLESRADARARRLLKKTTRRVSACRFETGLLWADDNVSLPDSRPMAMNRLTGIERKMRRDAAYAEMYRANIAAFLEKGYARRLTAAEEQKTTPRTWYLPHFGVANINKPNRLRLVFDAAATVDGTSLNTALLTGPDQYKPLPAVLFRFRVGQVGVSGDIQEMFLQVRIREADQDSLRFLWRDNVSQPPQTFVMQVMTFGARCSPCSAQYVKNRNAEEHRDNDPEAVDAIVDHHYVDDYVMSYATPEEAARVTHRVINIHKLAGFNLRNFRSNSKDVLASLGYMVDQATVDMQSDAMCDKILGMHWDTSADVFCFKLNLHRIDAQVLSLERPPTKRQVLSATMSIFDPFGILCNIMLYAKLLVQDLWRTKCGWDEQVPAEINTKWAQWIGELGAISLCRVPRCYSQQLQTSTDVEIHLFADASESAFAAVAYWRVLRNDGGYDVAFIMGKTRCAPQKMLSVPRLELQAAVLATRLYTTVMAAHQVRPNAVHLWTDSSLVLNWICSDHRRYKPFVAHRIAEILESTEESNWHWVPTADNGADDATRAKYPINFEPNSRWINGPAFLRLASSEWPQPTQRNAVIEPVEELRAHLSCRVTDDPWLDVSRFSKFSRMCRAVAWMNRFIHTTRNTTKRRGEIVPMELGEAERALFRLAQKQGFIPEYAALKRGKLIDSGSAIKKLLPYLDDDGTMRMRGRTDAATLLPADARRPILLPRNHRITWLLVDCHHQLQKHQNLDAAILAVRRRFWVPQLRSLLKKVKSQCVVCKYLNAKPAAPIMGQLPEDRVTAYERPFTSTGIDYFGPFNVSIGRRREKRWVALFTCMTTRAIHLELASDLSTDACIVCLRNFVNIRGVPRLIRSDNGTNFVGANRVIRDAVGLFDHEELTREMTSRGIEWRFNSPAHPQAGGCWERMVRCVKRVLAITMLEAAPKVETFRSLLLEAANIVNSRPLTHVPVDPTTEDPLTPNHFLLGYVNSTHCPGPEETTLRCHQKQWRIAQQMKDCFWRRWVREYLPELTRRTKWHTEVPAIKPDDLVLICDENAARSRWRRGRIQEVFPGKDGRVRNATVATSDGVLRRPASRLALLDVGDAHL